MYVCILDKVAVDLYNSNSKYLQQLSVFFY